MPFKYGNRAKKRASSRKKASYKKKSFRPSKAWMNRYTIGQSSGFKTLKAKSIASRKASATKAAKNAIASVNMANDPGFQWEALLNNPFRTPKHSVGIPDGLSLPTAKMGFSTSGTFKVAANTQAGIVLNPWFIGNAPATGLTNNSCMAPVHIFSTNGAGTGVFTATAGPPNLTWILRNDATGRGLSESIKDTSATAANGDATAYFVESPLTSDQVRTVFNESNSSGSTVGYNWRVVAAGLRVQYVGSNSTRSGRYLLYEDPCNDNEILNYGAAPGLGLDNVVSDPNTCIQVPVGEKEVMVRYRPKRKDDFDFVDARDRDAGTSAQYIPMAIQIDNLTTDGLFIWEAVTHIELIGRSVANKTITGKSGHKDPNVPPGPESKSPKEAEQSTLRHIASVISSAVRSGSSAIRQAKGLYGDYKVAMAAAAALGTAVETYVPYIPRL